MVEDLEGEIWITNNGYKISNKGRIITKSGKLAKMTVRKDGYISCSVKFIDGFIARNVHRAVAYAFLKQPTKEHEVNHKDGNKQNNCVENLEWVTKKENQIHASHVLGKRVGEDCYYSRLTEDKVLEIYNLCKTTNMLYKDIAKMYDVVPSIVSLIACGKKWKNLKLEPLSRSVRGSRKNGNIGFYMYN